jgi:hypothetical protein
MKPTDKTFRQYYFYVLAKMMKEPRRVFSEILMEKGVKRSVGVLFISSMIYSVTSILIGRSETPFLHVAVLLVNAMGMVFIATVVGYGLIAVFTGRLLPFAKLLPIYALSSGVTLLVAWLPYSLWFTEPWKWWLIGAGLTDSFALKGRQAVVIIIGSIAIITLLFSAVLPRIGMHVA